MTNDQAGEPGRGVAHALQVGTQIGEYRIESFVRRGGMALVYEATDLRLRRRVALKMLAPEFSQDSDFRERFLRESRFAASLDHPNIVPIYGAGEIDGLLYIAMRYVAGGDLSMLLGEHGPLAPRHALAILSPVADALDTAHAAGLIHRDVKPANILIRSPAGRETHEHVYLSDFGLTRRASGLSKLTATGQFIGTIAYIAPEQIRGDPLNPRTDLYAFGCVVHETLTGVAPFVRDNEAALLWAHLSEEPVPLSYYEGRLAAADPVLARALAKDPADRYESCEQLVDALTAALVTQGGPVSDAAVAESERLRDAHTVEEQAHTRRLSRQPLMPPSVGRQMPPGWREEDERDVGAPSQASPTAPESVVPVRGEAPPPTRDEPVAGAPAPRAPHSGRALPPERPAPLREPVSQEVEGTGGSPAAPGHRKWAWGAVVLFAVLAAGTLAWHPWSGGGKARTGSAASSVPPTPTSTLPTHVAAVHPTRWDRIAALPVAVEGAGAASFGDQLWVVGGNASTPDHHPLATVQVFNPHDGKWRLGPPVPQPVGEASVVSAGGSLYVLGGAPRLGAVLDTVYRLDDPQGAWRMDGHLPQPRVSGAAAFDGTRLVYAGGIGPDGKSHTEVFASQGTQWQTIGTLREPRDNFAAASDGSGTVWFFGGKDPTSNNLYREILRLTGSSVTVEGTLSFGVRTPAAVLWPGAGVCVIGGQGNIAGAVSCVARPKSRWDPPKLPTPRGGLAAAVVVDHVYAVGGFFSGSSASSVAESIRVQ